MDQEWASILGGVLSTDKGQGGIPPLVAGCPHLPGKEVLSGRVRRYDFLRAQALPSRGDSLGGRDAAGYSGQGLEEH